MRDFVAILEAEGRAGRTRSRRSGWTAVGDLAVRLSSYLQRKGVGSYLRAHVGRVPRYDTTKIRTELGVAVRPVRASILDTMEDLARWGHVQRA